MLNGYNLLSNSKNLHYTMALKNSQSRENKANKYKTIETKGSVSFHSHVSLFILLCSALQIEGIEGSLPMKNPSETAGNHFLQTLSWRNPISRELWSA